MDRVVSSDAARINAYGREIRRLLVEGVAGKALITGARDTGERLAGNYVLDVDLLVTVEGVAPYLTTLRTPIHGDDTAPYEAGCEYGVRVDPADRTNLAFA
jgi:hypothetical protein